MRDASSRSAFALRFIISSACVLLTTGLLGYGLMRLMPPEQFPHIRFPPAFGASTLALWLGSRALSRAVTYVRREKQAEFRRCLSWALLAGLLFVALQMAALNWLIRRQLPEDVATGDSAFVAVIAALHALHFVAALLFLVFVTLQARIDRYDHEYTWGVVVCAWFWHALGIVWLALLMVIAIVSV